MAVLECSCGMVMSTSAVKPRVACIRCGRAELLPINEGSQTPRAPMRGKWRCIPTPTIGRSSSVTPRCVVPLLPLPLLTTAGSC